MRRRKKNIFISVAPRGSASPSCARHGGANSSESTWPFLDQVGRWAPNGVTWVAPINGRKYMAIWVEATLLIGGLNGILRGGGLKASDLRKERWGPSGKGSSLTTMHF